MARRLRRAPRAKSAGRTRTLDARPDTLDFRDLIYVPTLIEVPERIELRRYLRWRIPILDQGNEGACTGFGLATVAHYLLRTRRIDPDPTRVSTRMIYEMARRHDEWPGERYEGSSARGAMKGWHKHGICGERKWPYAGSRGGGGLTSVRAEDALQRPLGAYFRVNHKDLVAMHAALTEVGVLYVTSSVHDGWDRVGPNGKIPCPGVDQGVHAFALVGYDNAGFWVQNSWGTGWGRGGFGHLSYDDWLANGTDVWVARLGAPVTLRSAAAVAVTRSAGAAQGQAYSYADLRPHVISIGNDGAFRSEGTYGTSAEEVRSIFLDDVPRLTKRWGRKRVLLYAHGGLVKEEGAIQRVADYRARLLESEVYPIAFVWKTDYWTTISNILADVRNSRRPEGILDDAKDFMLDRADDFLEPIARKFTGKATWDEMKENALLATTNEMGGVRIALQFLADLARKMPDLEIHVAGHSAGAILLAPLILLLSSKGRIASTVLRGERGLGLPIKTCTLWAPACSIELFLHTYFPALQARRIGRLALFTLTDNAELCDNCAQIYHKSLLYLVSNALEANPRIPLLRPDGDPVLGMEKFLHRDTVLSGLIARGSIDWIRAPNTLDPGDPGASTAQHHGDFDDDPATLQAMLTRIRGIPTSPGEFNFHRSKSSLRRRREEVSSR